MPQNGQNPGFYRNEEGLIPENTNPNFSDDITQTMSHLYAFDRNTDTTNSIWRRLAGDVLGRIRVTSGPAVLSNIQPQTITVNTVETQVLPANPHRQYILIDNLSYWSFLFGFRAGDSSGPGSMQFPNDFYLELDGYTGPLFARALNQTVQIKVTEI